jgi:hypothetical protein
MGSVKRANSFDADGLTSEAEAPKAEGDKKRAEQPSA